MNHMMPGAAARQAALTLHALDEADRVWMLEALPPVQRLAIAPLLQELRELGIPGDAVTVVAEVDADTGQARPADESHEVDFGTVARILSEEPLRLTATLLASRPRQWRDGFLASLGPDYARRVQAEAVACTPAPALQAAVLGALRSRVGRVPPEQGHSSVWQRFCTVLRGRRT